MNTLKYFLALFFVLSQSYGQQTKNSTEISITAGYVTGVENYWDEIWPAFGFKPLQAYCEPGQLGYTTVF